MKYAILTIMSLYLLTINGLAQEQTSRIELNISTGLAFEEFESAHYSAAFDQLSIGGSYYPLKSLELNFYVGIHRTDETAYMPEIKSWSGAVYIPTFTIGFIGNFHPLSLIYKQRKLRIDPYFGARCQMMQQPVTEFHIEEQYTEVHQQTVVCQTYHAGIGFYPYERIGIATDYTFGGFNVYERVHIHLKYRL